MLYCANPIENSRDRRVSSFESVRKKNYQSRGQRQENTDECEIWKAAWEDAWIRPKTKKGSIISWVSCRAWRIVGGPFLALHVWACGTRHGLPDSYSLGTDGIALDQPVQRTHTTQRPPPPAAIVIHHSHLGWGCKEQTPRLQTERNHRKWCVKSEMGRVTIK